MKLHEQAEVLEVTSCNLSSSTFADVNLANISIRHTNLSSAIISDVNLIGARFSNANFNNASLTDCTLDGMTINGILVSDLFAAYIAIRQLSAASSDA